MMGAAFLARRLLHLCRSFSNSCRCNLYNFALRVVLLKMLKIDYESMKQREEMYLGVMGVRYCLCIRQSLLNVNFLPVK